jgi:septum formation protein
MRAVTLASTSAIRQAMLSGAGVRFQAVSPGVDEDAVKAAMGGVSAAALSMELAKKKALAVSAVRPGLVIGADQVLAFGGAIFDKARDMAEAESRLRQLRGRTHELVGGVALAEGDRLLWTHSEISRLAMRDFSDDFLTRYLDEAGPQILSSVGCYQLEGPGAQLFERIEGDYFAVLGLPLLPLLAALRAHGGLGQ